MIGTVLGNRYRLDELIGEGGMALVYKAECSLLQRPVAVKILRPQFAADAEFVERFRREAQAAARLSHPNVVNVYDVGQDQGFNYIVMEYIRGENLKDLIKREAPFTVARALNIAGQICEALQHAHQNNIIHRDIKPHNILITPEGRVKVADFGIARAVSSNTLTQSGSVMGSVQYFSPEQAKGAPTGVASDLYSLGCVLYEMLSGTVPFKGESPIAIALKHLQEEPPPLRSLRPGLPHSIEALVGRSLAKDPSLRFPSAQSMLREIKAASGQNETFVPGRMDEMPTQVLPAIKEEVEPRKGRRMLWTFLGVIGAIFLGLAGFFWWWLVYSPPSEIEVPNLIGLKLEEARERASASGFRLQENWRSADEPTGLILRQEPEAGIDVKSRTLKVWISRGPEEIEVPDLIGQTLENAMLTLEDRGLRYLQAEAQRSATIAEGLVAAQDPAPGTRIAHGTQITISQSLGNKFLVEDYRGLTAQEAIRRLNELEVIYTMVTVPSDQPQGIVVDQIPGPGELRPLGTIVHLKVANGQEPIVDGP